MGFGEELLNFIGRWHPLFVHLPVGMLVIAFVMAIFGRFKRYQYLIPAISFTLLFGVIAAIFASITGYLLSRNGGYDESVLGFHQWLGIAVAICSLITYLLYSEQVKGSTKWNKIRAYRFAFLVIVVMLVGFTGHFGGTLTHGKGYLKDALPTAIKNAVGIQVITDEPPLLEDAQEAQVYQGIIQPILEQRCQSCHGDKKKEGGLALHDMENLLKGGENGKVLTAGDLKQSELYARLILPEGHEGRMPPKGRTPITPEQIKLIAWWIEGGADFKKKAKEIQQPEQIAAILKKLEEGGSEVTTDSELAGLPEAPILPEELIQQLQAKGIKIIPLAKDNDYVLVNAINYPQFSDKDVADLLKFKDNIIQLKLGNTAITDKALQEISTLPVLTKLHLEHTKITDAGLNYLSGHKRLSYINLFGVNITDKGIVSLEGIPTMKQIYAYQTGVTATGVSQVKGKLSKAQLDTGKYTLPSLATDTINY